MNEPSDPTASAVERAVDPYASLPLENTDPPPSGVLRSFPARIEEGRGGRRRGFATQNFVYSCTKDGLDR